MQTPFLSPMRWQDHPPFAYSPYASTAKRAPTQKLIPIPERLRNIAAPVYGESDIGPLDHDLTRNGRNGGEPIGERMIVTGRVLDDSGRPIPHTLVELWQANACGRYVHKVDQHDAPLDPNFLGAGRALTDANGVYRFLTIKPGAYPWRNHPNAWRPAHIHFSLFGQGLGARLITQMFFPGDPLHAHDPMVQSAPVHARDRLIADFSLDVTEPEYALGYVFDIVLRGELATPFEAKN
jgi:protocatechuate 3,4-dioxygenase, beta subunit